MNVLPAACAGNTHIAVAKVGIDTIACVGQHGGWRTAGTPVCAELGLAARLFGSSRPR